VTRDSENVHTLSRAVVLPDARPVSPSVSVSVSHLHQERNKHRRPAIQCTSCVSSTSSSSFSSPCTQLESRRHRPSSKSTALFTPATSPLPSAQPYPPELGSSMIHMPRSLTNCTAPSPTRINGSTWRLISFSCSRIFSIKSLPLFGYLFATQFVRIALVLTSRAAFKDMRSKGLVQPGATFAGHSLQLRHQQLHSF
jgi:hypothetical protein